MGVRGAVASSLTRAARALTPADTGAGTDVQPLAGPGPDAMRAAARGVSQMGMNSPFSPGEPIRPYDGYSRSPRVQDFQTGYNIATRPRTHERVSFETLKGLIDAYDVSQICIWHKIDILRGVKWRLLAADNYSGDVAGAIELGMKVMRKPDGIHNFKSWFGKWFYDVLAYDAAPLYRLRNRGGQVRGLLPFDGTTLAPLMDYWGNPPTNPGAPPDEQPEAYVQYANGIAWNWLTRADVIYEPFRAVNNSLYGKAPIEAILLNANTDIRFQLHFLQRFTDGNIPEAFASAPETWGPDQIEAWQEIWDSLMYGNQEAKNQIKWMPGGSTIVWSNEKDFTDAFSLFLMRKTCATFHTVPTDLGFTETSNYSSGESQADVQHKVGELPPMEYTEEILSQFLYDDLGLPLKFEWDRGEDQDDRLAQAQADQLMIDRAVVSSSEIREMRYGLTEPAGQVVPRIFFTSRGGPIPLSALYGVAGKVDPDTAAPDPGTPLPHEAFTAVEGVLPEPPLVAEPLAEQEYGPKAIPPAPPKQQPGTPEATDPAHLVAKEAAAGGAPAGGGEAGATVGITSETGLYGYDLDKRSDEDEDRDGEQEQVAKAARAELGAFRVFARGRRRAGQWRDFEFRHLDEVTGHRLNDAGRFTVLKAAGEVAVAGLAVQAADTGRVLMLQRALGPDDPAAGTWEFPGGRVEDGEQPVTAAAREWCEETGCILPFNPDAMAALAFGNGATWTSGIYAGFVYPVPSEDCVPVRSGSAVTNPDDPDGDSIEAIAWFDPGQLAGNPSIRPELAASLADVLAALGPGAPGTDCCGAECCQGACCGGAGGCGCTGGECAPPGGVAKARFGHGGGGPKAPAPAGAPDQPAQQQKAQRKPPAQPAPPAGAPAAWPGWAKDLATVSYWSAALASAFAAAFAVEDLVEAFLALGLISAASRQDDRIRELTRKARTWLAEHGTKDDLTGALASVVTGTRADGWLLGEVSARAVVAGSGSIDADLEGWEPGATEIARALAGEAGDGKGLASLLDRAGVTIKSVADTELDRLARTLAIGSVRGATAAELSQVIGELLADPSRAEMIVQTELARAMNAAATGAYLRANVQQVVWATADDASVCPACDANEAAGPVPLGEDFPSGDPSPPAHPRCRCAIVPV